MKPRLAAERARCYGPRESNDRGDSYRHNEGYSFQEVSGKREDEETNGGQNGDPGKNAEGSRNPAKEEAGPSQDARTTEDAKKFDTAEAKANSPVDSELQILLDSKRAYASEIEVGGVSNGFAATPRL